MAQAPASPPAEPDEVRPADEPFWRKPLSALTVAEWESLCDGCGRCCLVKLEDEDTGAIHFTDVACKLLDRTSCRCGDYPGRRTHVPDCVKLDGEVVRSVSWLPRTCAYRLVEDGHDLPWWHPLVSGRPETVHEAGISVRGRRVASEEEVATDDLPDHIVTWPMRWPKAARPPGSPKRSARTPPRLGRVDPGSLRREPDALGEGAALGAAGPGRPERERLDMASVRIEDRAAGVPGAGSAEGRTGALGPDQER